MSSQTLATVSIPDLEEQLMQFRLFAGIEASSLTPLRPIFELRKVDEGDEFIEYDAVESQVFFILKGTVQVNVPHAGRSTGETVCELKEGESVGEFLLARKARRSASCEAYSALELLVADAEKLREVLEQYPELGLRVYRNLSCVLCERLQDNNMLIRRVLGK